MPPTSPWQENDNSLCLITKPATANFISLRILSSLGVEKKNPYSPLPTLLMWHKLSNITVLSFQHVREVRQETFYEGQSGPHSVLWTSLNYKLRLYFSIYVPMQCTHAYRCARAHTHQEKNYTPMHGVWGLSASNIHDEVTRMARHLCRTGVLLYPFRILLACVLTWAPS